nr:glycosyltransferase family 2 protein [Granulicella sp. dw_53]
MIFWISFLLVGYAYVGYAALLSVLVRLRQRSVHKAYITPTVSIVIAARNEEKNLPQKLQNLRLLQYPQELIQIVVVSDGSTDGTAAFLQSCEPQIVAVILDDSHGKANALNEAVRHTTGEILCFLDTRQNVDVNALSELVSCLADPEIGAASGELLLENAAGKPEDALGLYWKIEKIVRKLESATGSVVGVTGAIYAIRREFYREIPPGTILDDVHVPMMVARQGKRVVFEPLAIARDRIFAEKGKEFSRKVRTLTGNYQLLKQEPWLISPANPLLFRLISHKLLRLLVPLLLVVMVVSSAACQGTFYLVIFWLQMGFYLLALLGALNPGAKRIQPVAIANTFVMLNAAAAFAFYNFVAGRKKVWV